jgi:predicted enzyme related to lactoylglutathione lyase
MTSPIRNRIKGVFIPVADIHAARDWYGRVFGFSMGPVLHGHLCCIEVDGPALILDAKLRTAQGEVPVFRAPAVMLDTEDTQAAYEHLKRQGVRLLTEILHGHYFNLADPDGNVLMVCGPNP